MSRAREEREFLDFLSEKIRTGEVSEADYDKICREGVIPLHQAGIVPEGMGRPLPKSEVTEAALRRGLYLMKGRFAELYPKLKSQMPGTEGPESGR